MEKIVFHPDEGPAVSFYVLEQTVIAGQTYILVSDTEDEDGDALILKDISGTEDDEGIYEIVTEETELSAVAEIFGNMLEGVELIR